MAKTKIKVGIKRCATCEENIKCNECVYPFNNKELIKEVDRLRAENAKLQDEIVTWKRISDNKTKAIIEHCNVIDELHEKIERLERLVKKATMVRVLREMAGENNA